MNEESQGSAGDKLTLPTPEPPSKGSSTRWNGAATRRFGLAPYTDPRWGGRMSARRGTRGLFVTRWRWMVLVTLVVVGAAALLSWSSTSIYRASADVLVQPRLFAAGTPPQAPDMGSEKAAAGSTVVLDIAARALGVSAGRLSNGLSVSVPLNTLVLHISYSSPDPEQARQRAQAVAAAYVSYWLAEQPPLDVAAGARPTRVQIIDTAVITPAKRPTAPASPNHVVDIAIALIIGLVLAGGTAYLRDRLDDRLRGPDEFEENGGGPLLGLVPAAAARNRADPVVARRPDTSGAEAYRELRTVLLRVAEQRGAKSLLVTTPVGDVQTTVSANVAVTLAQSGRQVVLVHADMRRPHGHELFGIEHVPGLADVLEGRASLANAVWQPEIPGPQIIPAGPLMGDIGTALHPSRLGEVVRQLSRAADIVVIDAPAALAGSDIATMVEVVDMVVLVGDARRTTRAQVRAAAGRLAQVQQKLIGCVLVNFGRRTRLVTPPLSLITGREDHPSSMPRPNDRDDGDDDQLEDGGADDSARWLLSQLIETLDASEDGVDQINGRQGPTTKMKR